MKRLRGGEAAVQKGKDGGGAAEGNSPLPNYQNYSVKDIYS